MNESESTALNLEQVRWPGLAAVPAARVVAGSPATSTVVVADSPEHQMGLWKATPGAFTTDHTGYIEFIHIVEGYGRLLSETGTVTELQPGTTTLMPAEWKGRWEVDTTLTKVFTVIQQP